MRKKDNNLNRGQVRRSPRLRASATPRAASIQSVCANNRPRCVYYLLSHLCRSLSAVLVSATRGTWRRFSRSVTIVTAADFRAAILQPRGAKSRSRSDREREKNRTTMPSGACTCRGNVEREKKGIRHRAINARIYRARNVDARARESAVGRSGG